MLSKILGAYGSSSGGVPARASAYETTSTIFKIPGVAQSAGKWPVLHLGDSLMHGDTSPLVQPRDVRAGGLDGYSGQQENCHYRCIIEGLASPLQWQTGLWHLDECTSEVVYKLHLHFFLH